MPSALKPEWKSVNSAIELEGVTWRPAKSFALQDLSLKVPAGAIYGFLGPNGSGKTSTIRLFMGMMKPGSGEIRVLGMGVPSHMPAILARVGYVPERPHTYPALTVGEQMKVHSAFFNLWDDRWSKELMERLDLDPTRKIARLSKGESGKLLLLLALSQRPDLLVLDEPTDGLDPVVRRDVLAAVLDYVAETNATVFISSHLIHELERICDWVGVLDHGKLVAEVPMQAFKNGIKRIKVVGAPKGPVQAPFTIISRETANGTGAVETWVVRGWEDPMRTFFAGEGMTLRDVVDLDLEEGFVELLRSSRPKTSQGS